MYSEASQFLLGALSTLYVFELHWKELELGLVASSAVIGPYSFTGAGISSNKIEIKKIAE